MSPGSPDVDVALLTASPTLGWRLTDASFVSLVRAAGATCAVTRVTIGPAGRLRRHPALTDLVEALAARHSAGRLPRARAVVVSSVTASFFQDLRVPFAVRFDAPAALNRPGPAGAWQRAIEPRALRRARVLLPTSAQAGRAAGVDGPVTIPLGVPIDPVPGAPHRSLDAVTYGGNPHKRGLHLVCAAWALAGARGRLAVAGVDAAAGRAWLARQGVPEPPGVEWLGVVPREEWLALLGSSRTLVAAARFEDHGHAALEALSAGAALVTVPSPGPYPALAMARALAPRLVAADRSAAALAEALSAGLAMTAVEREAYAARAAALLAPHRFEALTRTVADEILPALGLR